jgi:dipeptidyl-peptidase-4
MDINKFPSQYARTGRFSFGVPRDFTVTPRGVLFVRSASGSSPRMLLWRFAGGRERLVADLDGLTGYAADDAGDAAGPAVRQHQPAAPGAGPAAAAQPAAPAVLA